MKNTIRFTLLLLYFLHFTSIGIGQCLQNTPKQSIIHVTGTAEKEIVPNEIYITIRLDDYTSSTKKKSLTQLDKDLRAALEKHGFDPDHLYLSDAQSNRIHLKRKAIIKALQYSLMVSSVKETEQVFDILNTLKIRKAYISKTSHSEIEKFRKEVRIEAIKAAKNKANYTLSAIGEICGKPIDIQERTYGHPSVFSNVAIKQNISTDKLMSLPDIKFEKIKITTSFDVQFKIE